MELDISLLASYIVNCVIVLFKHAYNIIVYSQGQLLAINAITKCGKEQLHTLLAT